MMEQTGPEAERSRTIATQNDVFRRGLLEGLSPIPGKYRFTVRIQEIGDVALLGLSMKIACFDDFGPHNNPHGERDYGALEFLGKKIVWKIDYYDSELCKGASNPADLTTTCRILTVMLAEEY